MTPRADRTPRRRLDVDQRRDAILAAARALYEAGTYSEVSTARIAQQAGASPALVFHYFGSKAGLYAAVVDDAVRALVAARQQADAELAANVPVRDRVRAGLLVHLDHVAARPSVWLTPLIGGQEPKEALDVRLRARAADVEALAALLRPSVWARHEYALWGYFGFLDQACLHWIRAGCPDDDRYPLVDAALGALHGALGDWGA